MAGPKHTEALNVLSKEIEKFSENVIFGSAKHFFAKKNETSHFFYSLSLMKESVPPVSMESVHRAVVSSIGSDPDMKNALKEFVLKDGTLVAKVVRLGLDCEMVDFIQKNKDAALLVIESLLGDKGAFFEIMEPHAQTIKGLNKCFVGVSDRFHIKGLKSMLEMKGIAHDRVLEYCIGILEKTDGKTASAEEKNMLAQCKKLMSDYNKLYDRIHSDRAQYSDTDEEKGNLLLKVEEFEREKAVLQKQVDALSKENAVQKEAIAALKKERVSSNGRIARLTSKVASLQDEIKGNKGKKTGKASVPRVKKLPKSERETDTDKSVSDDDTPVLATPRSAGRVGVANYSAILAPTGAKGGDDLIIGEGKADEKKGKGVVGKRTIKAIGTKKEVVKDALEGAKTTRVLDAKKRKRVVSDDDDEDTRKKTAADEPPKSSDVMARFMLSMADGGGGAADDDASTQLP